MIYRALRAFVFLAVLLASGLAEAACTSPTGNEGTINYDTTNHILQYCNGTSWTTAGGGSSQWTTSGSIIYYNTGNVGIGSTSPGQKLSVAGTIESTSGGVKFPDGTTQTTAADITPNVQTFNASGTWTKPTGGTMARLQCWGGGGGGGSWNPCCNGGGGGGGYNETTVTLATLGASQTVTVGAGGAAATAGGNSSIGTLLTATGGTGGTTGSSSPGIGGGPGSAAYAAFMPGVWTGGNGADNSAPTPAGVSIWGAGGGGSNSAGGTSLYGGSGGIGSGGSFANATAGTAPGGGGGGGKGAAGAAGRCIITVW
jgi:hypothetical protein